MSGGMREDGERGEMMAARIIIFPPPSLRAPPFFPALIYELKAKHPSDDPGNGDHCRNQWALPLDRMMDDQVREERGAE